MVAILATKAHQQMKKQTIFVMNGGKKTDVSKVSKGAKIRNTTNESHEVSLFPAVEHPKHMF